MISFFTDSHALHAPEYEFYRGQRVPCFEMPARATYVREQLLARGHKLRELLSAPRAHPAIMRAQISWVAIAF